MSACQAMDTVVVQRHALSPEQMKRGTELDMEALDLALSREHRGESGGDRR